MFETWFGVPEVQATAAQRRRLKQLHWDKLKQAREGTVWSKASKEQLRINYDELESLFQVGQSRAGMLPATFVSAEWASQHWESGPCATGGAARWQACWQPLYHRPGKNEGLVCNVMG